MIYLFLCQKYVSSSSPEKKKKNGVHSPVAMNAPKYLSHRKESELIKETVDSKSRTSLSSGQKAGSLPKTPRLIPKGSIVNQKSDFY
jgi:hypothetical protein